MLHLPSFSTSHKHLIIFLTAVLHFLHVDVFPGSSSWGSWSEKGNNCEVESVSVRSPRFSLVQGHLEPEYVMLINDFHMDSGELRLSTVTGRVIMRLF